MDISDGLKIHQVRKGVTLLHQGDICNCGYKVVSGCLKNFALDQSGKEHIIQFAPENWIIADLDSLLNQKPAATSIVAIEDSEIIKMGRDTFERMGSTNLEMLQVYNNKLLKSLIATNKRLIALLALTAQERYLSFIETYPTLVKRIPLKQIASYIGVTPEYLSEIRRKIAGK